MSDRSILSYPEVPSLDGSPSKLIVLVHGYGSDGNDLIELAPIMQPHLPECHFISPHGIEPCESLISGRQWFSLSDRNNQVIQTATHESCLMLGEIIKDKQNQLGLSNQDTVLLGFSQGTMMSLYLNLSQKDDPFNFVIGFSGRLIPPMELANFTTPICLIHGDCDDVVEISEMNNIATYLSKHSIPHTTHVRPNLKHSIDAKGLEIAINCIRNS